MGADEHSGLSDESDVKLDMLVNVAYRIRFSMS